MASSRRSASGCWTTRSSAAWSLPCMAETSWSMVMATRSGFDGVVSLAAGAPLAAGDGEGNVVTWPVLASPPRGAAGAGGKASAAVGGSCGSSSGATAVAIPADDVPPSKRFQSGGGGETFQTFAGDSNSTPTWKSSRGLAGGWTDFTKARMTGEIVSPSAWSTRRPTDDPTGYSWRDG